MNFNLDLNEHDTPEIEEAVLRVLRNRHYLGGPEVPALEAEFAERVNRKHAVAVGSGTDAIYISLRLLNIGPGDEVITSAFGPAYTALAIAATGARPVFVDVEPNSLSLDPYAVERAMTKKTSTILPVHFFGERRPYPGKVGIEDAAQVSPRPMKNPATFTVYSCYPTKNLGAFGEAGIIALDDERYLRVAHELRDSGRADRYTHVRRGLNMVMDEVQAAVLRVKLRTIEYRDGLRRGAAATYYAYLRDIPGLHTFWTPEKNYAPHLFVVQTSRRERLFTALTEARIPTFIHYPIAVPDQPVFAERGDWPVARKASNEVLSLPFYPSITSEDQRRVVDVVARVCT